MTHITIERAKLEQALDALKKNHYYMIDAGLPNQSMLNENFEAITSIKQALSAPVQEQVAAELERIAQEPPVNGNNLAQARVLMAAQRIRNATPPAAPVPLTDEPVRIYDYVWPQRDEHKNECVYACSYTPGHHLARGELLAVVHPSQLKNAYLQRDGEAAHGITKGGA